ncbi:MAG: D-alanine--D-alanine ligase [Planctomycetaceae bacterium]
MNAILRIAVLYGGTSAERTVSLESGSNVAEALRIGGHEVTLIDPQQSGLDEVDWTAFDVVFNALHGTFGEDGTLQTLLDAHQIPYTGSDAVVSQLAFNKAAAKQQFQAVGIATPAFAVLEDEATLETARETANQLGFPLVVKPNSQGSSFGVSIVRTEEQLAPAIELARRYDDTLLLEVAVLGEEWTVPFVGETLLPPIRVSTQREFFDYQAKYLDEETGYLFAATSSQEVLVEIEETARAACRVLGTRGVTRVDLRLDAMGRPFVLEVNTSPGMTHHSLVPKSAERIGWTLTDLCENAIRLALRDSRWTHNRHEPQPAS